MKHSIEGGGSMQDIELIKKSLTGRSLAQILKSIDITKWRAHKDCGISYRTLWNWEREKQFPSEKLALRVGKYLGLIKPDEIKKIELKKKLEELEKEINRLG